MRKAIIIILITSFVLANSGIVQAATSISQDQPIEENQNIELNNEEVDLLLDEPLRDDGEDGQNSFHQEQASLGTANIKGLSGSFNVDQFSGAAVYGYNLELPPGRAGLTPSLSLNYNSHQTNRDSLVGYGWSLGQSYVVRSARRSNELYEINDFTLVINGQSMELVPINLTDETHGEYGAKHEEAFLQIEFLDNESWQVTSKSGQLFTFGTDAVSRQDNPEDEDMIYKWMLEDVRDNNDNYISYEYYKEDGQIYPKIIKYTGNNETDGPMKVLFEPFYSEPSEDNERIDSHKSLLSHFEVITKYLIDEIVVLVDDVNERKYSLVYEAGENEFTSLLTSVQRFGYSNNQLIGLPENTFIYQEQSQEWGDDTENWNVPGISNMVFDNGQYYTRSWGGGPVEANGDGWTDYAHSAGMAALNTKDNQNWGRIVYSGLPNRPLDVGMFADFNGDGLTDYIGSVRDRWEVPYTAVSLNNPTTQGWNQSNLWMDNLPDNCNPHFVVDINGDGLADLIQVIFANNNWSASIHFNNGDSTWTSAGDWADHDRFSQANWQRGMHFIDVNADGLPDMVKAWGGGDYGIYLNNGQGWNEIMEIYDLPRAGEEWMYGINRFSDINNDGLVDIVSSKYDIPNEETTIVTYINNGNGWDEVEAWASPLIFIEKYVNQTYYDKGVRLFDINGDSITDFIQNYSDPSNHHNDATEVLLGDSLKPNILSTINNGYGSVTEIEYLASAKIQDQNGDYRNSDLPFNLYTVDQVTVSDGLGNEIVTSYDYFDGSYYIDDNDPLENQYAGFHQVNQTTGDKVIKSYFHQGGGINGQAYGEFEDHITKKGKMYRQEVYQDLGENLQILSQTINKWGVEDLGDNRTFVFQDSSTNFEYENGVLVDNVDEIREQGFRAPDFNDQDIFSEPEVIPIEIEDLRSSNSKQFRIGDTSDGYPKYRMKTYTQAIHYLDDQSEYQDIDTTLVDNGNSWLMEKAEYQSVLPKTLSQSNYLSFTYKDEVLGLKPVELNFVNIDQSKLILSQAQEVGGSSVGKKATYYSAYGTDLDLEVTLLNQALRKELVINNLASLGVIDSNIEYLEAVFELDLSDLFSAKITDEYGMVNEILFSSSSINEITSDKIEFTTKNGNSIYIWEPYATDKNNDTINIELNLVKKLDKLYLNKLIPIEWLKNADYPIRTDATVSYETGGGDGFIIATGNTWEQVRNANSGEANNEVHYIFVGASHQGNEYSISRGFLSFDTSELSEEAVILDANVSILKSHGGNSRIYLVQTNQENSDRLINADYNNIGNVYGSTIVVQHGMNVFDFNEEAINWIAPGDWTKVGFKFSFDYINENTDDHYSYGLDFSSSENRGDDSPALEIVYTLNQGPYAPAELETEGVENPINVNNQTPEFSAVYQDFNQEDQATHYQIQVIEENGDFNEPLWDSEQTELNNPIDFGQRSEEIVYDGDALDLDGVGYYWRIKFWDNGEELNNEGAWSTTSAYFEMAGSLAPSASTGLLAEDYEAPIDLVDQTPEFSAIYNDPNPRDIAKWYQVQVDNNQDFSSPTWDSEKTLLNQLIDNGFESEDIFYDADPLPYNGTTYYWRIKFWDDEGENGTEGVWSELAQFTMFDDNNLLDNASIAVTEYNYNLTNGNLVEELQLGKVNAADNGVYLDQAGDSKVVEYEYAESQEGYLESAVKKQIVTDPQTEESTEQEIYYDDLDYGQVSTGNLTKEDLIVGEIEYEYSFNDYGLVTAKEDPLGQVTSIIYDEDNYYPAETTNDINQTVLTEYDLKTGQVIRTEDPNGLVEERDYDAFGRLVEVRTSHPYSQFQMLVTQQIEYNDNESPSWVKQTNYPNQNFEQEIITFFDGLGRKIQTREQSETANQYRVTSISYNNEGNVYRQSLPYFDADSNYEAEDWNTPFTEYVYDSLNRVLEESVITSENEYVTSYEYDGWDVLITDANGNLKKLYKDAHGNLVQTDEYLNGEIYSTTYEYNLLGKITKITDSENNTRSFEHDSLGRLISQEEMHIQDAQEFGVWHYEFDDASNMISKTDPNGNEVNYTYDDLNRLLTEDYTGQEGVEVQYTYDQGDYGIGRLRRVQSEGADTTYYYDKFGRVEKENKIIDNNWYSTKWEYDIGGRLFKITYPDNFKVYYSYNNISLPIRLRIAEADENILSSKSIIDNVSYSPLKQMAEIEYHNGTVVTNTFDEDQAYRLTHKSTINQLDDELQDLTYAYDSVGNIISLTDSSDTLLAKITNYNYDDLYRLTTAEVTNSANNADYQRNYSYDIIGNILNKSDIGNYSYQNTNPYQASDIAGTGYQYDANGNLTSDGVKTFNYNWNDRLAQVNIDEDNTLSNQYDQSGQRTVKQLSTIKPDSMGGEVTWIDKTIYTNKLYEEQITGLEEEPENWQSTNIRHVSLGNQTIAHVKKYVNQDTKISLVFGDHLGSASILTDSFGRLKTLYDYYPFGGTRQEVGDGVHVAGQRYTGQELDEEIGLNYFGARYQDGEVGRFTQVDPRIMTAVKQLLSDPQALNGYSYARNNPIRYIDPNGETFKEFIVGVSGGTSDWLHELGNGIKEFLQNPTVIVTGIANFFGQSGSDLGYLANSYFDDPEGTISQIKDACSYYIKGWDNLSDEEKGKIVGYSLGKSLETYVATKGIKKAFKEKPQYYQNDQTVDMAKVTEHARRLNENASIEVLDNGNTKYYSKFRETNTEGGAVNSRFVVEVNGKTNQAISTWQEFYGNEGQVLEVRTIPSNKIE